MKYIFAFLILTYCQLLFAQQPTKSVNATEELFSINLLNPELSWEKPGALRTTWVLRIGIGYGGAYPKLSTTATGFNTLIAPFGDLQHRFYLNRAKSHHAERQRYNSGGFLMMRGLVRGKALHLNFARNKNTDYAVGVAWGYQNFRKRIGYSFSVGPYYYFDGQNSGFFPLIPEVNVGYRFSR